MLTAMPGYSLFFLVLVGLLAGVTARAVVGRRQSLFASLLTGLAGAAAGGGLAALLGLPLDHPAAFAAAAVGGAVLVLSLVALVFRR